VLRRRFVVVNIATGTSIPGAAACTTIQSDPAPTSQAWDDRAWLASRVTVLLTFCCMLRTRTAKISSAAPLMIA
jgi:hypothetical protein